MMRWKTRVFSHFKFEIPNLRFRIWNSGIKTACFKSQIKFDVTDKIERRYTFIGRC